MARSLDLPISHCPVQAVYQRPGRGRNPAWARRVPFFATRRIIEGLGLGLARRAARKLVPVVLTLGSGPSGFPRKLSARRPKLPRQPWQTRVVVRARAVIVALGAGPSGFPKQLWGDGRSFRDSHGKPAPSFARAPLFWRWGLARRASRNNFPGDGQSICDSVPRARFRRFSAGEWPDGLPETSFRATQASATAMADPRRRSRVGGLGLGLARRAARKLDPVVLTLGSGPSGFPRKLSGRRPKLPRQPRRGRVARARSRIFDAGSWPVGLLETTFRATAEASATAMANPRRRTRALRYFGAGGWPVGLPETKASATASLALASVVLALGVGPTGFPKQVSERCKARGSWTPTAMANPRQCTRALRYFGAGGWPVGLPETIFRAKLPRQPGQTRAVAPARSVILALGAGPSGSRNKFPSDAKRGDVGGRRGICGPKLQHGRPKLSRARARQVAAMAVLSTRSGQMPRSLASGCGWPISYCPV